MPSKNKPNQEKQKEEKQKVKSKQEKQKQVKQEKKQKVKPKQEKEKVKSKQEKEKGKKQKGKKGKKDKDKQQEEVVSPIATKPVAQLPVLPLPKELETLQKMKSSGKGTEQTLQVLISHYKQAVDLLFVKKGHDPIKEKAIQNSLQLLQKQKQQRHDKLQRLASKYSTLQNAKEQQDKLKQLRKQQREKQRRIKDAEKVIQQIQNRAIQREEAHKKEMEEINQLQRSKPKYKLLGQRMKQRIAQEEQQYTKQIQQIKERFIPLQREQLDRFEEEYLFQKKESDEYRKKKLSLQVQIYQEEAEKLDSLWKGKCHDNVQEELTLLQQKKDAAKAKRARVEQYWKELKQKKNNKPIPSEEEEESITLKPNEEVVYRYKFYKGESLGRKGEPRKVALSVQQKTEKGNQYLESIHKKVSEHSLNSSSRVSKVLESIGEIKKEDKSTYRMKKAHNPYYEAKKTLEGSHSRHEDFELQDKIMRHGEYQNVLQLQERKSRVNSLLVGEINSKLDCLSKL